MDTQQILDMLKSSDPDDIREGAYLAGNAKLKEAVPYLAGHIESTNAGVIESVDYALRTIGGEEVLYAVLPLLRSEEATVRNLSMDVLRAVGQSNVLILTELLKDPDPDLRIFGADILGSTHSSMAVPALSKALLNDEEANVRYQAAISLGQLGFTQGVEGLNKALKDSEEWVEFAVIDALTKIGSETSVEAMLEAWGNGSDIVASTIVDALGEMGYIKAVPQLIEELPKASIPLANKIVRAIVKIVGVKFLNLLGKDTFETLQKYMFQALEDEDVDVQDAAIKGLSGCTNESGFRAIFNVLSGLDPERDRERMLSIIQTLASMGFHEDLAARLESGNEQEMFLAVDVISQMEYDPRIAPLLKSSFWSSPRDLQRIIISVLAGRVDQSDERFFLDVLKKSDDGTTIKSALTALGTLGDAKVVEKEVLPFLEHPYDDVKEAALEAAIMVQSEQINKLFADMTSHEDPWHRVMAYYALGKYAKGDNSEYIQKGLKDESAEVRRVATEAVRMSGCPLSPDWIEALVPCLEDENREVRFAALDTLGNCRQPETKVYLVNGLKDEDPWIRARCVENIARSQPDEAVDILVPLLKDKNPLVLVKAIQVLSEIGGDKAFTHILPLLRHKDIEIQHIAECSLEKIRSKEAGRC